MASYSPYPQDPYDERPAPAATAPVQTTTPAQPARTPASRPPGRYRPQSGTYGGSYTPPPNAGSWNEQNRPPSDPGSGYPGVQRPSPAYPWASNSGNLGRDAIINAYWSYAGRMPSEEEITAYYTNGQPPSGADALVQVQQRIYDQYAKKSPYTMGSDFKYNVPAGSGQTTPLGQYSNKLEGFEASKLSDPTHASAKYMFARVASKYAPTQEGFAQLVQDPEFQRLGMQSLGNGKIRLPNGDIIDVVRGFGEGGHAWQWGAETENGVPTGFSGPAPGAQPAMDPWSQYAQQQQAWQQQQAQQWMDYYRQMAQWQYTMSQPQTQPAPTTQPAPAATPPPAYDPYAYAAPYNPYAYAPYPTSPDYGGYGYNAGVGLQNGYAPAPYSPYAQTFSYLSQGMPSPYFYG